MNIRYCIDEVKFVANDDYQFIITGWILSDDTSNISIKLTDEKTDFLVTRFKREDLVGGNDESGFTVKIKKELINLDNEKIGLIAYDTNMEEVIYSELVVDILKQNANEIMLSHVDNVDYNSNQSVTIQLWAINHVNIPNEVKVLINGVEQTTAIVNCSARTDVNLLFNLDINTKSGYSIILNDVKNRKSKISIVFSNAYFNKVIEIDLAKECKKASKIISLFGKTTRDKVKHIYRVHGFQSALEYIFKFIRMQFNNNLTNYDFILNKNKLDMKEVNKQKATIFEYNPKISIVIPLYNTPLNYLKELLDSIVGQTYGNWQLCLVDGSDNNTVKEYISNNYSNEHRIVFETLKSNDGISNNTNEALKLADGDYIMFSDHDDLLAINALYEIVDALNKDKTIDFIYTDEDKVDMDTKLYYDPHFKPNFNLFMLRSNNYICHIVVVKNTLLNTVGQLRNEYDGAQDYDFVLRCCEKANKIHHISKVLYHWRNHPLSTAGNPESKAYAVEAGRKAVASHYDRLGLKATVTTVSWGRYRTTFEVDQTKPVTIVVINELDHNQLDKMIDNLITTTKHNAYEIIIVDNKNKSGNYKNATHHYLNTEKLPELYNFGATCANNELIVFLNSKLNIISADWLTEMIGYIELNNVGVVGTKIKTGDNKLRHGGIVLGLEKNNRPGVYFYNKDINTLSYAARVDTTQSVSAVVADCFMTTKSLFNKIGGFNTNFYHTLFDVDYCLRSESIGNATVYNAFVEMQDDSVPCQKYSKEDLRIFNGIKYDQDITNDQYFNKHLYEYLKSE